DHEQCNNHLQTQQASEDAGQQAEDDGRAADDFKRRSYWCDKSGSRNTHLTEGRGSALDGVLEELLPAVSQEEESDSQAQQGSCRDLPSMVGSKGMQGQASKYI